MQKMQKPENYKMKLKIIDGRTDRVSYVAEVQ